MAGEIDPGEQHRARFEPLDSTHWGNAFSVTLNAIQGHPREFTAIAGQLRVLHS